MSLLGAGGYGLVIQSSPQRATKLFYEPNKDKVIDEYEMLQLAYDIASREIPEIGVPVPYKLNNHPVCYQGQIYLSGFEMEMLHTPICFEEQVHMILGYSGLDIDDSWGRSTAKPVSEKNPTRGFFASPKTMELIWREEESSMTLDKLAYIMGKTYRLFIEGGLLPVDVEWVWSNGKPYVIDFGSCHMIKTPISHFALTDYLYRQGSKGLASDIYIPHQESPYYEHFLKGYYNQ